MGISAEIPEWLHQVAYVRDRESMPALEAVAALMAVWHGATVLGWRDVKVRLRSDCTPVIAAVIRGWSASILINNVIIALNSLSSDYCLTITPLYVATQINPADAPSRPASRKGQELLCGDGSVWLNATRFWSLSRASLLS